MIKLSKIEKIINKYKSCYNLIKLCSKRKNIIIYELYYLDFFEYINLVKMLNKLDLNKKEEILNLYNIFKHNFNEECFTKLLVCLEKNMRINKELILNNLNILLERNTH